MLRGDLTEFAFPAMLQMLLNGGRTGHLRIQGQVDGDLWLDQGELVYARALNRQGPEALTVLGCVQSGELLFEAGQTATERNLTAGRDAVLRQLLVDESTWKPLLEAFPDWTQWLRFTPRWTEQQPVNRYQYRALMLVGRMSVRDMVQQSDLGARQVLALLYPFRQAGLIEPVPAPPPRTDTAPAPQRRGVTE
ncbi:DUF4388 domain-containing protein [Deinococcus aquiradiocola]|uniref:Protein containing PATAN domain n=1 Tax=Deinococcus aquiradiocola TaxID=393059 RepID=A0A917PK66_9DEIO|nr:DUF4388 domain-containing protein [Deinococcus aquiradiocola]GGJ81693.1 protein containing PATAN domain [Deinococcus aquiradiocola]